MLKLSGYILWMKELENLTSLLIAGYLRTLLEESEESG